MNALQTQPARECLIPCEINQLNQTINELDEKLSNLLERLDKSVLSSPILSPKSDKISPDCPLPPLGEQLRSFRKQLSNMLDRVQDVNQRIEI